MKVKHIFYSAILPIIAVFAFGAFFASAETTTSTKTNSATATSSTSVSTSTMGDISVSSTPAGSDSSTVSIAAAKKEDNPNIIILNQEIAARKDKIKQLEDTITNYKSAIATKQTESVSLKNQLSILSNQTAQLQVEVDLNKEKIKETQLEIDALSLSIDEKEKYIERQKIVILTMIQSIQSGDQKNYFEIMLTYKNFTEFYNESVSNETVYVDLGRSVKALRLAMDELDNKRKQVETKKLVYDSLEIDLEGKQAELNGEQTVKLTLLDDTKSSEARYQALLSSLKSQYQVVENEQKTYEEKLKAQLEQQDKISTSGSVIMSWPVPSHVINATFHDATYPFKNVFEHSGIDIKASYGTPVRAAASGYVARARRCTTASCYAYVLIIHNGSISSVYGHLSGILVAEDQFVNRGDIIGYSGGTPGTVGAGPFVTGAHLHFEVRLNGIPTDPMPYME